VVLLTGLIIALAYSTAYTLFYGICKTVITIIAGTSTQEGAEYEGAGKDVWSEWHQ
jgi:hypothetical protein